METTRNMKKRRSKRRFRRTEMSGKGERVENIIEGAGKGGGLGQGRSRGAGRGEYRKKKRSWNRIVGLRGIEVVLLKLEG